MEFDPIQLGLVWWTYLTGFLEHSALVLVLKFFLFVYVMVVFVDIVLLLVLRGLSSDLKTVLYGSERPLISKNKQIKRFEAIRDRLETGNPSQYKVAILEADTMADELLDGIGFKGVTMAEKLALVQGGQLQSKETLMIAHETRNQIVHDAKYALTREQAEQCLEAYRKFFEEIELF